jgi:KaiC domain protein
MAEFVELGELKATAPKLFGVPTKTKIDEMFFTIEENNGKFVKKPLNGIPYQSVINITGIPDTGKSLLAEQFAAVQADMGYKVLFVSVESPAPFLYTSLKQKANALNLDFSKLEKNIVVIDAAMNSDFREDTNALLKTMETAIESKHVTNVIIDSITGLYEHKEMLARQIVRIFFNFLKKHRQTGIFVSQKRSSQDLMSSEAAGGLAVAHIVDGTIVMGKEIVDSKWKASLYNKPFGSVLRTIRIDGCRITGHDDRTWIFEITEAGTINIEKPLEELVKGGDK